jgi:transcriptional regulator
LSVSIAANSHRPSYNATSFDICCAIVCGEPASWNLQMYVPPHFANSDLDQLQDAIERYSFALIVSRQGERQTASHLPLLIDRQAGPCGTLWGHFARANSQWREAGGQRVLVVFSGPHAYISPQWYEAERVVPTWNYVAVHAYGRLELVEDAASAVDLLDRMVRHYEAALPRPWNLADQPAEFIQRLAQQIVAFRIPIERLEGKWKLNQNHPQERREKVVAALEARGGPDEQAIARLMREY